MKDFEEVIPNSDRWFNLKLLKNEEFRNVLGYETKYQVSNYGRVKSVPRVYRQSRGYRKVEERIIKCSSKNNGYFRISIREHGGFKYKMVHRLVGEVFLDNPSNKPQINHKDKNRQNNRIDNLEWVTQRENVIHEMRCKGVGSYEDFM